MLKFLEMMYIVFILVKVIYTRCMIDWEQKKRKTVYRVADGREKQPKR